MLRAKTNRRKRDSTGDSFARATRRSLGGVHDDALLGEHRELRPRIQHDADATGRCRVWSLHHPHDPFMSAARRPANTTRAPGERYIRGAAVCRRARAARRRNPAKTPPRERRRARRAPPPPPSASPNSKPRARPEAGPASGRVAPDRTSRAAASAIDRGAKSARRLKIHPPRANARPTRADGVVHEAGRVRVEEVDDEELRGRRELPGDHEAPHADVAGLERGEVRLEREVDARAPLTHERVTSAIPKSRRSSATPTCAV